MIVMRSSYTASAEAVDEHRPAHLVWLQGLVDAGRVLGAGRLEDGTGAVILGPGTDAAALLELFEADPYCVAAVARYEELISFPLGNSVAPALKALDA